MSSRSVVGERRGAGKRAGLGLKLGLAAGSLALSLLGVEALFYRYFPQPTYAVRFSPWGFEHIPNISFKHTPESKETVSYVEYNGEGFRGRADYAIPKPPDTLRVAILGDSYAEGAEVDYRFLHGTVLEDLLGAALQRGPGRYRRAEVLKAGVYAYDSCQELRLFEARVAKYRPDVVFVIYTGELKENTTFCGLNAGELAYVDMAYSRVAYLKRYAIGYLKAKSHLLNYVNRVLRHHLGGTVHLPDQLHRPFQYEPPEQRELGDATRRAPAPIQAYLRIPPERRLEALPQGYEHQVLFAIFERLEGLTRGYGGRLHVMFSHAEAWKFALAHFAERTGIRHVDLFSYLNDRRTRPTHLRMDGHWNEYGHLLVARAMFELVQSELAAEPATTGAAAEGPSGRVATGREPR